VLSEKRYDVKFEVDGNWQIVDIYKNKTELRLDLGNSIKRRLVVDFLWLVQTNCIILENWLAKSQ